LSKIDTRVSFRLIGPSVDPEMIEDLLKPLEGNHYFRSERYKGRENAWTLDSPLEEESELEEHLDALWTLLEPFVDKIQTVVGEGCAADIFVSKFVTPDEFGSGAVVYISKKNVTMLNLLQAEMQVDVTISG
jgi:hypothetical protein